MAFVYLGEIAALSTAFCWAIGLTMHTRAGRIIGPLQLNLIRLPLSVGFLSLFCIVFVRQYTVSLTSLMYLALSGFVGLALGDTFLYAGLVRIGARLGALIFSLSPAVTVLLGYFVLGERLGIISLMGIVLTMSGILWVVSEKQRSNGGPNKISVTGLIFSILSAVCQAFGLVLMKKGLNSDVHSLYASLIRMVSAAVVIWPVAMVAGLAKNPVGLLRQHPNAVKYILLGGIVGPVLGVWLSLVAVRFTETGVAATLIAMEPIILIPLVMITEKERPSLRAVVGTIIAVIGTAIIFLR
ncbi:MAG: DMT family transporter [Desulfobacteraceae bacterium]|nr:DMT family transporter [Desulfobacteraceae bacterium]